jgi:hypothetical protein
MKKFSKQIGGWVCTFTSLVVFGALVVTDARASQADVISVAGQASFIKHRTLTPLYCPDYRPDNTGSEGCLRTQSYWALSIQDGPVRYELDQILAEGEEQQPDSIMIGGVLVRPGVSVSVKARATPVTRSFSLLTDLQEILILDRAEESAPFFGWTCESVGESQPVYVDVFQNSRDEEYSMRVQTMVPGESSPRTLASLDSVSAELTDLHIRFSGVDQHLEADLAIDSQGGLQSRRDSVLKITTRIPSADLGYVEVPVEAAVKLVCGRTR